MKISSQKDIDEVNERFNYFHDGLLKSFRVTSDNDFWTDPPWESQRQFTSNEEELWATGLFFLNSDTVEIVIHHYNYDWPNQPRRRAIIIRARSARVSEDLMLFLGDAIYDLTFTKGDNDMTCVFTYHKHAAPVRIKMENGTKIELFSAPEIEIEETIWAEEFPPGYEQKGLRGDV